MIKSGDIVVAKYKSTRAHLGDILSHGKDMVVVGTYTDHFKMVTVQLVEQERGWSGAYNYPEELLVKKEI